MAEIRGERRLRKIELFRCDDAKQGLDPLSVDLDVVVEEQDRLVAHEEIGPNLHEAPDSGHLGSRLNRRDFGFRMDAPVVIGVEENVEAARLIEVGRVEALAALDEDEEVALRVGSLAFDTQPPGGVEAILARPQFLPVERRAHLALGQRAIEDPEGRLLERAGFCAASDVAEEFKIDIRPRAPARPQPMLEKVQKGMGVAPGPVRVLGCVPGVVEFAGRGGGVRLGTGEIDLEQASVRVLTDVRALADIHGIEEGVGAVAEPLADQRVMHGRERRRVFADETPPGVQARPERPPGDGVHGGPDRVGPNAVSNAARSATSASPIVAARPRSARLVTP